MSDCEQWREAISAWLDGQCNPGASAKQQQKEVQAHLDACPACRAWVEQVEADRQSFIQSYMGRQADISQDVMRRVSEMSVETQPVIAPQRPRPSFSLIELLVVIGIAAVLAAVLFPVFARAREKARQPSCLSNIKQIMLATLQYAQEYNEVLPPADRWVELTQPYLRNTQVLICPSDQTGQEVSYAMVPRWGGVALKDIADPANTIVIYEADHGQPATRHNDGMNVGYADGHAKWIKKLPDDVMPAIGFSTAAPSRDYGLRRRMQLAYDASLEVWVKSIQPAVVAAEQVFTDRGGFVLTSVLTQPLGRQEGRSAHLEGKVPTAEVAATIAALAALGYVARREVAGQDMTDRYVAGMRTVSEATRTVGAIQHRAEAAPPAQRPALREQARAARDQLGVAQDTLFGVQREVALATITATLIERAPAAAASASQVARAWHSFCQTASKLGVVLVWIGLYGLFFVPVIVGVVAWRRWKR